MRPSPIMTTIIGVFLAALGVFLIAMSVTRWHADAAVPSLIVGAVCLVASAVSFWGTWHWR